MPLLAVAVMEKARGEGLPLLSFGSCFEMEAIPLVPACATPWLCHSSYTHTWSCTSAILTLTCTRWLGLPSDLPHHCGLAGGPPDCV